MYVPHVLGQAILTTEDSGTNSTSPSGLAMDCMFAGATNSISHRNNSNCCNKYTLSWSLKSIEPKNYFHRSN